MNSIDEFAKFADSTRYLHVGENVLEGMKEDFKSFAAGKSLFVVADENTMAAAGDKFLQFCRNEKISVEKTKIFAAEPELTSDYSNIEELKKLMEGTDLLPVAVGSGTINDLVKRSSHETGRPYAVYATACSVDGYASDGAAILYKGLKQTLPCAAPVFIGADTGVLKNAPSEMTAAGYADLLAKNPGGSDWIIADTVELDPIDKDVWPMIQGNLAAWTANPTDLSGGDSEAYSRLFTGLNATGFAMQYMKKSRPASGAEHLMSHIWEMEGHTFLGRHVSHGFKVGIGSLATVALTETVLSLQLGEEQISAALERVPTLQERLEAVEKTFSGTAALKDLLQINREKYTDRTAMEKRLRKLSGEWEKMRSRVSDHLIPYGRYKSLLGEARCPVRPADIGLSVEKVLKTYAPAQMMRNRYTILDLAEDTGLMTRALEMIGNSDTYFH